MTNTLPRWTFDDAFVAFDHPNYQQAQQRLNDICNEIQPLLTTSHSLLLLIQKYEEGNDLLSSLQAFCRCQLSDNTKNEQVAIAQYALQPFDKILQQAKAVIFQTLNVLPKEDTLWQEKSVKHFQPLVEQQQNTWRNQIKEEKRQWFQQLSYSLFSPLYGNFTHLNHLIDIEAENQNGEKAHYNLSKCAGILKGANDGTLRQNIVEGLNRHYAKVAPLYADLLNQLHGFRLAEIEAAGVDYRLPSTEQNRMSTASVEAMFKALEKRKAAIQETVTLRAKYFGSDTMKVCDLLAPSPYSSKATIPFEEGIQTVKTALGKASQALPDFIDMMLEKRWLEAEVRENKAGGAFYTRFNCLKQPRVFSSYMGTMAHMIQQAHELGHAWHYWIMRDLPTIHTEFPMTLAEVASTFNEALLRQHLRETSEDKALLFGILWQELKSAANFMLHIPVRYDFECRLIQRRKDHFVTATEIDELLQLSWRNWYGDSTTDVEKFLPYFKLHFYKTDQYLYNYPYTVGYLLSQFLINEFKKGDNVFMDKYKAFLRDTGVLSVDDILWKHFQRDISKTDFWLECIDMALSYSNAFKEVEKSMQ